MKLKELSQLNENELLDTINTLSNEERIELREYLESIGDRRHLARNLHYNYETQEWI